MSGIARLKGSETPWNSTTIKQTGSDHASLTQWCCCDLSPKADLQRPHSNKAGSLNLKMEVVTLYKANITLPLEGVIEALKTNAGILLKDQTDLTTIQSTLDAEYEKLGYSTMVHYHGTFNPQRVLPAVKQSIVVNRACVSVSNTKVGLFNVQYRPFAMCYFQSWAQVVSSSHTLQWLRLRTANSK